MVKSSRFNLKSSQKDGIFVQLLVQLHNFLLSISCKGHKSFPSCIERLRPLSKHTHKHQSADQSKHGAYRADKSCIHQATMQPLSCQELDNADPCEDTR
jgi:hypothetical protein